jgi:DNA repair photolyase
MKKKVTSSYGEQLLLFPLYPEDVPMQSTSVEQELFAPNPEKLKAKPSTIGSAKVEYVQSKSLLKSPCGFISLYKFTLNPYSGCSFGCDYCYARFFSQTLEQKQSWGEWVQVKENAVELLRKARRAKSLQKRLEQGDTIYMSTVTDPYQPIEHKIGLTREILKELLEVQPRLTIQTRSPLATRDIDLFQKFDRIRVNFTITTDSEEIRKRYEPYCSSIEARLKAAKQVADAGIPIGISISPMLPIIDAEKFARRIAELDAAEYVTQFFKPTRSRFFSAGSSESSIQKLNEDQWKETDYNKVRQVISHVLGSSKKLLEGNEGYAPA